MNVVYYRHKSLALVNKMISMQLLLNTENSLTSLNIYSSYRNKSKRHLVGRSVLISVEMQMMRFQVSDFTCCEYFLMTLGRIFQTSNIPAARLTT
jgi:hypothetical protein